MRIPKDGKKVYSWRIFSVYEWPQKNFDGSIITWERVYKRDTAIVLPIFKWKIILARQKQPDRARRYYSFIAGKVEDGETPRAGAKRELLEESWLSAKRLIHRKTYDDMQRIVWPIHIYIAKDCQQVQKPSLEPWEKIKLLHLTFEEFIAIMESWKLPARSFENDILRMDKMGTLKEFKKLLLD